MKKRSSTAADLKEEQDSVKKTKLRSSRASEELALSIACSALFKEASTPYSEQQGDYKERQQKQLLKTIELAEVVATIARRLLYDDKVCAFCKEILRPDPDVGKATCGVGHPFCLKCSIMRAGKEPCPCCV